MPNPAQRAQHNQIPRPTHSRAKPHSRLGNYCTEIPFDIPTPRMSLALHFEPYEKWKPRDHGRPRKPAKLPLVVRTALPRRPPRRLGALPRFRCCVTLQNFEYVGDLQDPVPRVVFQPKGFYWYIFVFISVSAISQSIASRSARVSESGPENVENDGSAQAMDWPHRPSTSWDQSFEHIQYCFEWSWHLQRQLQLEDVVSLQLTPINYILALRTKTLADWSCQIQWRRWSK